MMLLLALADETDYADETSYLLENVIKTLEYALKKLKSTIDFYAQ